MKMRKKLAMLLAAFMCITSTIGTAAAGVSENEATETQVAAEVSENEVTETQVAAEEFENILQNGEFENLESDGKKACNWNAGGGSWGNEISIVEDQENVSEGDVPGNGKYLLLKANKAVYVQQSVVLTDQSGEFKVSADLKAISGTPMIKVEYYGGSGFLSDESFTFSNAESNAWESVEEELTVPENTVKISILVRLIGSAGGELCWDNIRLLKKGQPDKVSEMAKQFREMLEEENRNSQKVEKNDDGDPYEEKSPFPGQPENLLKNSSFEEGLDNWLPFKDFHEPYSSLAEGEGYGGGNALRFSATKDQKPINPIRYQVVENAVGGAVYQVSYRYKIVKSDNVRPLVKIETYGETINEVLTGYSQANIQPKDGYIRDGEWHYVVMRVRINNLANQIHVMARALDEKYDDFEVLIDDIKICMTDAPVVMTLDTENIFFYDDAETATFSTTVDTGFYPQLASAKVDFEVYDGVTKIWEQKNVMSNQGVATVSFALSGLTKEIPYCVKATIYYQDGSVAEAKSQNIYIYSRPEYLRKDGIYTQNGTEEFVPVIAYHVLPSQYEEVASAGINVVQMEPFGSAEEALEYLNAAQAAGIKGFIPLYNGMKPAGEDSNIERTIRLLSDERVVNHPALFGYGVMDEVFVWQSDPYADMESSFRLIRMLDTKHPIMSVEAFSSYYGEVGKLVDILVIDPYNTAESKSAYNSTKTAMESVYYQKPVYVLLEAYRTSAGRLLSPEDVRNNNYQALIAGAKAIGYYSIRDAERDDAGNWTIPIWNAKDGGAMWNALKIWGTKEKEIAYDHFVLKNSQTFREKLEGDYWYTSWKKEDTLYLLVLGMKNGQELNVSIPLTNSDGSEAFGNYKAEVVAGGENTITGNGTLEMTVHGVETVLYKITSLPDTDGSSNPPQNDSGEEETEETTDITGGNQDQTVVKAPQTGDNAGAVLLLACLVLAVGGAVVVTACRKQLKK